MINNFNISEFYPRENNSDLILLMEWIDFDNRTKEKKVNFFFSSEWRANFKD